jgi:hypothetical protein
MRRSTLAVPVMAAIVLAACGSTPDRASDQADRGSAADTPTPSAQAADDPLEGEWRTEFTCRESVGAIQRRLSESEIRKQIGSWDDFLAVWNAEPSAGDPCHGADATSLSLIARFLDGNLALCDGDTGACDVHATYELGDGSITIEDPEDNLCPCPATWRFRIVGERATFRVVGSNAYAGVIGTWEAAPWTREA